MEALQKDLSQTLDLVMEGLEAMKNSNDASESVMLSHVAELEGEWERRRRGIMETVNRLRQGPQVASLPLEKGPEDAYLINITEPRLPTGNYQLVCMSADELLRVKISVTTLGTDRKLLDLVRSSESGDMTVSFTIQPEDAPASLALSLSSPSSVRFTMLLNVLTRAPKRFLFFQSDAASHKEMLRVAVGYIEDISDAECHEAILSEAMQRRLCPDAESAREASQGRLFMRYHRTDMPPGTYTHYLRSHPDSEERKAGQSVFFLRHGATDLFAFGDGDAKGIPLESVDYIRVPPETQRTNQHEDEVDYLVALDHHPMTHWRRIRDPSMSFSSRDELMECVHDPDRFEAMLMLELS